MCGICGHLHHDRSRPVEPTLIKRMAATLRRRGPDDEGYYISGPVGLGMRRLAVIDPAGAAQPIANEDRSVFVVCNGEIYNFQDLRHELTGLGHRFATHGDVEVIVHAYEQWGDDALRRLNGMFAFALWDARRERLLLARDRMGEKPLYWHDSDNGLIWASEAKTLLIAPWVDRRVNPRALHHYLSLQYTPNPLTIFESISQLPPAHKLVAERGQNPVVSRWWQLQFTPKTEIPEREALEGARTRLVTAVKRQLVSDVPLGAFLSGGIDSATVVALMSLEGGAPVKTFSIGFEDADFNELAFARMVAERYDTEHHERKSLRQREQRRPGEHLPDVGRDRGHDDRRRRLRDRHRDRKQAHDYRRQAQSEQSADGHDEQGDEERWQAQVVLVDGANAQQGCQQEPRYHGANNPDHDVEEDALLGVGVHNDTRDPPEDTADDQPQDKIHTYVPLCSLKRRRCVHYDNYSANVPPHL